MLLKITDQKLADKILSASLRDKAKAINEVRHKCTNYDDYVNQSKESYDQITSDVRQIVSKAISESELNRYQQYLYQLLNMKWNFHKKNKIKRER